jgi:hypothetical protein
MDEQQSLNINHSKWECEYHVGFIPKCRRKTLYTQLRRHLGRGVPQAGRTEGKQDRGRAFDARSCPHDDIDPAEIRRVTGDRLHQGEKRDAPRTGIWGDPAEFRRTELLGTRVFSPSTH